MRRKIRRRRAGYAVGYGRPPTSSQFQPGQSGNPKGRPRGARNASSMARDALERTINVQGRKMTVRKAAYLRLAERAVAGTRKRSSFFYRWRAKSAHPGLITRQSSQCLRRIWNSSKVSSIVGGPACRNKCSLMQASRQAVTRKRTTDDKTNFLREAPEKITLARSKWINHRSCSE
jgi:hypothetical protein